jgi:signal recognition particle subunit SEC65
MNNGTIKQLSTGEMVVHYTYNNDQGEPVTQQLSIHPYFKNHTYQVNDTLNFEYAMECEIHYPKTCTCERVRLYALPIFEMTKQRRSFLKRVAQYIKAL